MPNRYVVALGHRLATVVAAVASRNAVAGDSLITKSQILLAYYRQIGAAPESLSEHIFDGGSAWPGTQSPALLVHPHLCACSRKRSIRFDSLNTNGAKLTLRRLVHILHHTELAIHRCTGLGEAS